MMSSRARVLPIFVLGLLLTAAFSMPGLAQPTSTMAASPGRSIEYDRSADGAWAVAGASTVAVEGVPPAPGVSLAPAQPNPFHHEATLRFAIDRAGPVRLDVYDVSGRHVLALVDEGREAGPHTARWSGRDDAGGQAPAGIYFVRLDTGGGVAVRKVLFTP